MSCFKGLLGKKKNSYTVNSGYEGRVEENQYRSSNGNHPEIADDIVKDKNQLNNSEVVEDKQAPPVMVISEVVNSERPPTPNGHVVDDEISETRVSVDNTEPPKILVNGEEENQVEKVITSDIDDEDAVCHSDTEADDNEGEPEDVISPASVELVETVSPETQTRLEQEPSAAGDPELGPAPGHLDNEQAAEDSGQEEEQQFLESPAGTWDARLNTEVSADIKAASIQSTEPVISEEEARSNTPEPDDNDDDTPTETREVTTTTTTTTYVSTHAAVDDDEKAEEVDETSDISDVPQNETPSEADRGSNQCDSDTETTETTVVRTTETTVHTTTVTVGDSDHIQEGTQDNQEPFDEYGSRDNEMIQIGLGDVAYVDPRDRQELY